MFPDLRNLGVLARALIFVSMVATHSLAVQPVQCLSMALAPGPVCRSPPPRRWSGRWQVRFCAVLPAGGRGRHRCRHLLFTVVSARWFHDVCRLARGSAGPECAGLLVYFHTLGRALSPSGIDRRLQALGTEFAHISCSISINGVLGVLRSEPGGSRQSALMDMADLFRVLMRENRDLQPLADENHPDPAISRSGKTAPW